MFKRAALSSAALVLMSGAASAGGIEWLSPSDGVGLLFQKGRYAEFSLGYAKPSVSGTAVPLAGGRSSGNMAKSYTPYSLGLKLPIGPKFDFAFTVSAPDGADVNYPTGTFYPYAGSTAKITETEYKALLRYKIDPNFSVYGGLRLNQAKGTAHIVAAPALNYTLSTNTASDTGYLLGVAYEKPEIALRVALTYSSPIKHSFDATEGFVGGPTGIPSQFETTLPKSWTLDFQTGVAPTWLLFGSVEWREWKAFDISPVYYTAAAGGALVSYNDNTITYTLGVGHKFTDTLSGAVSIGYEKSNGGFSGNLGPTNGYTSLTLAMIYTKDHMKITTGVSYYDIGNAKTENPYAPGTTLSNFNNNHQVAVGVKVGYSF